MAVLLDYESKTRFFLPLSEMSTDMDEIWQRSLVAQNALVIPIIVIIIVT